MGKLITLKENSTYICIDFSIETTKVRKQRANIMCLKKKTLLKGSISSKATFKNKIKYIYFHMNRNFENLLLLARPYMEYLRKFFRLKVSDLR